MPSLDTYRKKLGATTLGEKHKVQSDMLMELSWDGDIASQIGYLYDQEHDEEFASVDVYPMNTNKIPVEVKFYEIEYNSLAKDEVPYHIMFKPSYVPNVPYYEEKFKSPYGATYPIGLYIDLKDENGQYHRWLIVGQYRAHSMQFPSYLVLPADYKLQWAYHGNKYEAWCVLRSQSSYNSGVWINYRETSVENQKIVWLPTNPKTQTIFYDQRLIISAPRETPITWSCSKVEEMSTRGISRYTFAQTKWNDHTDYIEKDANGNIIGMWADYYMSGLTPTPIEETEKPIPQLHVKLNVVGKPEIMIGFTKKLQLAFFNEDEKAVEPISGTWEFTCLDENMNNYVVVKTISDSQFEIKLDCDDEYIGEILLVTYTSYNGVTATAELAIGG